LVTRQALLAFYAGLVMKGAFVLQMVTDAGAEDRPFAGWIEEVDTGVELKFRSADELLDFLRACVERAEERDEQEGRAGRERRPW
jgi:hypothetical protein